MCYRFEAQHAYFKSLVPVVRNFKNIPLTLAYRNQALHCSRLATFPGVPSKKYLYEGDKVSPGTTVLLRNLPNAPIFYNYVLENERLTCQMIPLPICQSEPQNLKSMEQRTDPNALSC